MTVAAVAKTKSWMPKPPTLYPVLEASGLYVPTVSVVRQSEQFGYALLPAPRQVCSNRWTSAPVQWCVGLCMGMCMGLGMPAHDLLLVVYAAGASQQISVVLSHSVDKVETMVSVVDRGATKVASSDRILLMRTVFQQLRIAVAHGHTTVVLGAFACDRNPSAPSRHVSRRHC